jgi:predicted phosphodiesterase
MRIAMISDIHGNPVALDAVLADIESTGGVDEYWILGDHVNQGYDPVGVIERLAKLQPKKCISGNTDRYLVDGTRRGPSIERVLANPELMGRVVSAEQGSGWARGALTATGYYRWVCDLPFELRMTLPDGSRLLGVHASLETDEWVPIETTTAEEAAEYFPNVNADLVFSGHAHLESDHVFDGTRYITLGSVANSMNDDLRPKYAILEADESGYQVTRRRVELDYDQVVEAIKSAQHPSEPWLLKFYTQA